MKTNNPNFIIDIESIHCKCRKSSSQICQLTDVCSDFQFDLCGEVTKLLSVDPQDYSDAPREGIWTIMEEVCDQNKNIANMVKFIIYLLMIICLIVASSSIICFVDEAKKIIMKCSLISLLVFNYKYAHNFVSN